MLSANVGEGRGALLLGVSKILCLSHEIRTDTESCIIWMMCKQLLGGTQTCR